MTDDPNTAVLGVDGGGSTCRLAWQAGEVRHVVTLGAANVTTDFDAALAVLREGLSRLSTKAGIGRAALMETPAWLGLAGIVDDRDAERVRRALPLKRARVGDDRRPAVRGALGAGDGAVAGLGTGSFFARQAGGAIRVAGGWGARLGDEASGFWIGRAGLVAALASVDALAEPSDLTETLLARLGGPKQIVDFAWQATPAEMADLAPEVIAAAEAGDPAGRRILAEGADHVAASLTALGWRAGEPICLTGGVAPAYARYLPEEMAVRLTAPRGSALDGALQFAREFSKEIVE